MKKYFLCVHFKAPREDIEVLAELCLRFTPLVVVRKKEALFLEWGRGAKITSFEGLKKRITVLFRKVTEGAEAERDYVFSYGESIPEAFVRARYGVDDPNQAPIESIQFWIDPLEEHPEWIGKIHKMSEGLFWLGVRRLFQIKRLERAGFLSRFGELSARLLDHLEDPQAFLYPSFRPKERWSERKEFWDLSGSEDLSLYLFEIKTLLDRVLLRLFSRGKALTALRVSLEKDQKSSRNPLDTARTREVFLEIPLRFTFPQTEGKAVLRLIQEKFTQALQKNEFSHFVFSSIAAIQLEVMETHPRREAQLGFAGDAEEKAERFQSFVSQLSVKLDEKSGFFLAEVRESYRPEKSWERVLKIPEKVTEYSNETAMRIPPRPLRFFTPAQPLQRVGRFILWEGRRCEVRGVSQIERIQTEWWEEDDGVSRTYFRVDTEEFSFWIYRERGNRTALFVQGLF
jgi:hypothetical protein